jgi:hypothetical protein
VSVDIAVIPLVPAHGAGEDDDDVKDGSRVIGGSSSGTVAAEPPAVEPTFGGARLLLVQASETQAALDHNGKRSEQELGRLNREDALRGLLGCVVNEEKTGMLHALNLAHTRIF